MKRVLLSVGLTGAVLLPGCMEAGDPETTSRATRGLINGELDLVHDYNLGLCVGYLGTLMSCRAAYETGPGVAWCTATLIAPTVALTSRRCVERAVPGDPNDCSRRFSGVLKDPSLNATGSYYIFARNEWNRILSVRVPQGYNVCTDDLAVLVLESRSSAEPSGSGNAPAGVDLTRDLSVSPPSEVALVGRGPSWERYDPGTGERVELERDTTRRSVQGIPFECTPGQIDDCSITDYWSEPAVFTPPAGIFAYGPSGTENDAGAGVFDQAEFGAGTSKLLGIHTGRTMAADGTLSGGYAVRLAPHANLLRTVVCDAALAGRYVPPSWALPCEGPSPRAR